MHSTHKWILLIKRSMRQKIDSCKAFLKKVHKQFERIQGRKYPIAFKDIERGGSFGDLIKLQEQRASGPGMTWKTRGIEILCW